MKVGTKLTIAQALPLTLLIIGFGYLDIRRSSERYRDELRREGRAITRTVQLAIQDALRDRQLRDVEKLVDEITGFERVLGLRLFNPEGRMAYQSEILRSQTFTSGEALQHVLATREPAETRRTINGEWVVTYIVPLEAPNGTLYGAVQLIQLESFVKEDARATRRSIIALTIVMVVVSSLTLILGTNSIVGRPVARLVGNIRSLQFGTRTRRLTLTGDDELSRLAQEFNAMIDRLESAHTSLQVEQNERRQAELRYRNAERLAALGQLAAGLAHEIGTPLNVIGGRTDQLLRRARPDEPLARNLRIISDQINRITRIVREMMGFARISEPVVAATPLGSIIESVLDFVAERLATARVQIQTEVPLDLPPVVADADQIYEVVLNVILNAADALAPGGKLRIQIEPVTAVHPDQPDGPRRFQVLRFEDNGRGIPPDIVGRVFDPFFTTKRVGQGSGLGLSVSYGIVREHGGWIEVQSQPGQGTRVSVYLPVDGPVRPDATPPMELET